jgi:L-ascorbate metabolism protein UlaG (beta-lactamase superfamily)
MMQYAHANPLEAGQAFTDLKAKRLIPMHYGTFDLSNEPISEPKRMMQEWARRNARQEDVLFPAINEPIYL